MTRKIIRVDARPHAGQLEVHSHPARFKVLAAGRRWGKTRLGVHECLEVAAMGGRAWWVAPSYKMGVVGWRPLSMMGSKIGAEVRKVDRQILLPNGGEVTVRSADDPNSLRGEGLDFVVLDECAYMSEAAWNEALRPALSDRQGKAMFISTPKGRNWFWRRFQEGLTTTYGKPDAIDLGNGFAELQVEEIGEWKSWRFPTSTNPHIAPEEIEAARLSLPENIFNQEYLAEFLENDGAVFRKVYDAATAERTQQPHQHHGHTIYFGVDWGKQNDFTVVIGLCRECRQMVMMDRFNQIDYAFQRKRLHDHVHRWKPVGVLPERNSMGEPIIEELQREGMNILTGPDYRPGYFTSATTKPQLIEDLSLAIERGDLAIMDDPVLVGELLAYERSVSKSGRPTYNAPEGMHDDTVMALALAHNAAGTGGLTLGIL